MPVTTFLMQPPPRPEDEELAELLDELNAKTGEKWYVETRTRKTGTWRFTKVVTFASLYKHLGGAEYQDLMCVNTVREAKAYLLGAIGRLVPCDHQHLVDQAESVNIKRLLKAMTLAGCAAPESHEEAAARFADLVNSLTLALVSEERNARPSK